MSTRVLGRTGLPASRLGLGLAALGRPGYINLGHGDDLGARKDAATLEREAHEVLDAAYAGGIRYFDAARSYGKAEEFLASWLESRGLSPGEVTVGSKWGYTYTADWHVDAEVHEVKDLSLATLRRQLAESRALLGPHLRVYQIHSATRESGVLGDRAVLDELAHIRETGLAIGLTVTGPSQRETIERALEVGIFDTVQATWNLLERSAGPALAAAHAAGLGVSSQRSRDRRHPEEQSQGTGARPRCRAHVQARGARRGPGALLGGALRAPLELTIASLAARPNQGGPPNISPYCLAK